MASTTTLELEIHTGSEDIPPVYHVRHGHTIAPEIDPIELRKIGALSSEYISSRVGPATLGDLESSGHHEEQAVGLVPTLNK